MTTSDLSLLRAGISLGTLILYTISWVLMIVRGFLK